MTEAAPRVAIVDDEECVRRALERLLRSSGLKTVTHESGLEFLTSLEKGRPDCVVLDLHMPDVSGFEVMELLPASIPVVVITGHDSPETQLRAGRASSYLRKPVDGRVLLEAIFAVIPQSKSLSPFHHE